MFINHRAPEAIDDVIAIHMTLYVEFSFLAKRVDIGKFLFQKHVESEWRMPTIRSDIRDSTILFLPTTRYAIAECYYHFFSLGYKYHVQRGWDRVFHIGCHICGQVATGYSAEDPSKLLCGPICNNNKK